VEQTSFQIDLLPAQRDGLSYPKAVPVHHHKQGTVSLPVPA